jgi:diacylglycerol kinase (ATP)
METGPVAVLVNPTAGRGRHRSLVPAVLQRLSAAGRPVVLVAARAAGSAVTACREALADGASALVAVGGDGTVHVALQAVAGTGVPFGVVPAGTGNDIAAALNLPSSLERAAEVIVDALDAGRTRPVDLGRVTLPDGAVRWFGGVLGAGFDALVNERANRMRFPRGPRRYDVAILPELLQLRPRHYAMAFDGVPAEVDAILVAVANCPSYGGGFRICPDADPTDGKLDILVGGRFTRRGLLRIIPRVRRGTHLGHPLVTVHRASTLTLAAEGITGYADGERLGPLPFTIDCVPAALAVLSA